MKVTFLKRHLQYNINDVADVPEDRAAYWLKIGLVTATDMDNDKAEKQLKKKLKKSK